MSGKNNGTDRPIAFRCSACRKNAARYGRRTTGYRDDVKLTGRVRKLPVGRTGCRNSAFAREYVCVCGFKGWSRHVDLEGRAYMIGQGTIVSVYAWSNMNGLHSDPVVGIIQRQTSAANIPYGKGVYTVVVFGLAGCPPGSTISAEFWTAVPYDRPKRTFCVPAPGALTSR